MKQCQQSLSIAVGVALFAGAVSADTGNATRRPLPRAAHSDSHSEVLVKSKAPGKVPERTAMVAAASGKSPLLAVPEQVCAAEDTGGSRGIVRRSEDPALSAEATRPVPPEQRLSPAGQARSMPDVSRSADAVPPASRIRVLIPYTEVSPAFASSSQMRAREANGTDRPQNAGNEPLVPSSHPGVTPRILAGATSKPLPVTGGNTAPRIYAADGTFLGILSKDGHDPESISNPYGKYGSPYGDTVKNPHGRYGSPFSSTSATNPHTKEAPRIYAADGMYLGKLSENEFDSESISNSTGKYGSPYGNTVTNPNSRYGSAVRSGGGSSVTARPSYTPSAPMRSVPPTVTPFAPSAEPIFKPVTPVFKPLPPVRSAPPTVTPSTPPAQRSFSLPFAPKPPLVNFGRK